MSDIADRQAVAKLGWINVDCKDPLAVAEFWSALLGYPTTEVFGDPPHYSGVAAPEDHPELSFQRVPEGKVVKNRLHLDLVTKDLEGAIARVVALGGRPIESENRGEYGHLYRLMADPEGNEFCLILET